MKRWLLIIFLAPCFLIGQSVFTNIKSTEGFENQVVELKLSGKKIDHFPDQIKQFTNLEKLTIRRTNMDSLPPWLKELPIRDLRIVKSRFQTFPKVICELAGLTYLDLGHNYISEVPSEISNLKELEVLNLWGNGIYDLPEEVNEMSMLKSIDLRVIDLNRQEQMALREKFPNIKLEMSPPCNCM